MKRLQKLNLEIIISKDSEIVFSEQFEFPDVGYLENKYIRLLEREIEERLFDYLESNRIYINPHWYYGKIHSTNNDYLLIEYSQREGRGGCCTWIQKPPTMTDPIIQISSIVGRCNEGFFVKISKIRVSKEVLLKEKLRKVTLSDKKAIELWNNRC